jgi:predicted  nucleic acid-binding Zn-ribbon protein
MRREVGMDQENLAPLIEFIGKKFDQVDQRFEAMDRRFEAMEVKIEEGHRHTGVLIEAVRDDVRQVAEGVAETNQRLDRFEQKVEAEFVETRAMIRVSYAQLDRRIQDLEGNYASLSERVERLESSRV